MIHDSGPWKDELLQVADRLEAKSKQKRWTERSSFLVERDTMISAYAIRKLAEAFKISDALRQKQFPVLRYDLTGPKIPDVHNRYEFWDLYDIDNGHRETLSLLALCNQLIHSWVWSLSADEHTELFDGIYVSSDRERKKRLFFIAIGDLIVLCREVGNEEVYKITQVRNEDGQRVFTEILGRPYVEPPSSD